MSEAVSAARPAAVNIELGSLVGPAAAVTAMVITAFSPGIMNDGDTWWHLAAGEWMLEHRTVPRVDVFSHSKAGAPWQAHEWLSEVLMALVHRAAGWSGLMVLFGGAAGLAVALMARRVGRSLSGAALLAMLGLAFACLMPTLWLRPHVLTLPVLVAWTGEILAARDDRRAPRWPFALLLALWANLHGSYVLGPALMAPFALEALLEDGADRRRAIMGWGGFGLLCVATMAATPHGVQGLLFPFQLMSMPALDGIGEWKSAQFSVLGPFEIAIVTALYVAFRYPVRVPLLRLVLLLILLHMALKHGRHLAVLACVAPLVLAGPIGAAIGRAGAARASLAVLAGALVAALLAGGLRLTVPAAPQDSDVAPIAALAKVPAELRALPVLNEYGFGGYLIHNGVRPYIDGRTDLYGDAFVRRYQRLARGDPALLDETLDGGGIAWTLFPPNHMVVAHLDRRPGWRRLYADEHAVAHVRAP